MGTIKKRFLPVILTAVVILLAAGTESLYFGNFEFRYQARRFNRIISEKERIMQRCLDGMKPILARGETHGSVSENWIFALAEKNDITLLEYVDSKLFYWSSNNFNVPRILTDSLVSKPMVFIQNGWFLTRSVQSGNEKVIALLRLYSDYGFENDVIRNGFLKTFKVSGDVRFSRDPNASPYRIFNSDGSFLFTLQFPLNRERSPLIYIPVFLWLISFILILWLVLRIVRQMASGGKNSLAILACAGILAMIYSAVLILKFPPVLYQTELFIPYKYSLNYAIPSLGHLLLFSILLSFFSFVFYRYFDLGGKKMPASYPLVSLLMLPGTLSFALFHSLFINLVYDSNVSFETYKVLDLSFYSLAGFLTAAFLFSVPFLYFLKLSRTLRSEPGKLIVPAIFTQTLLFIILYYKRPEYLIPVILFYLSVTLLIRFTEGKKSNTFNRTVVYSVLFGIYSLFVTTYFSERKNEENAKIQLVAYSTEVDPVAEHLLLDMWPRISGDTVLARLMDVRYFDKAQVDSISDYLHDLYFDGYWGNFTFNPYLCMKNEGLRINGRNERVENCFTFFDDRILLSGHQLTGTGFYFMDNKQGRSNYLGRIIFDHGSRGSSGLFIDLYSDINVFQPGYSEILLDSKYHPYAKLKNSSFAKYINGDLVVSTGDYPYNKTDASYIDKATDYRIFRADKYNHVLYRNGNVTVIISSNVVSFRDALVSFAYLFTFFMVFSNLILFFVSRPILNSMFSLNFRKKLQVSFIGILFMSFAMIGFVVSALTIKQYKTRHYENLKEKLNSVYVELENRLGSEKFLNSDLRDLSALSLDELLVRLSNTFNTDINLYDLNGFLIATSRPEIFYRNLMSRRIDNMAYINLKSLNRAEYFQRENIGNLGYVSGYIPFYNSDNELLAYLNLPYFRMQSVLSMEISNTIVTVINFLALLIVIAMGIAVFISNRLTSPLAILSSRLATVELGKRSEHLSYKGNDEVGELVKQYNRMVDELDESAQKLASSEREYAWREMAKQVAHEIKNPLTPMKLNVQQLLKSWKDGVPGFDKKIEKFTRNQIEYIDDLSSIASAFSSFAKIPEAKPVTVDLVQQARTTLELFKNSDNITFRISWPPDTKFLIYADKEQINSILSNIIKNAIQSIPLGREGIIRVNMAEKDNRVLVSVSDNGTGIPDSLKRKLFTPNFTTKSSGTGLGLSIARQYAENAGGRIWFESEAEKGSVFHIEFPLIDPDEAHENGIE